ncbi:MAG: hypothetical protein ACE1Y3_10595, partial [Rhodospirillales bacterium]
GPEPWGACMVQAATRDAQAASGLFPRDAAGADSAVWGAYLLMVHAPDPLGGRNIERSFYNSGSV